MSAVVGGLRTRLVYDSVFNAILSGMGELGWFDPARSHLPLTFLSEPVLDSEEVKLNAMAMSDGPMFDRESELGSNMANAEYAMFVDIYAESGPVGRAIANDLRDLIMGRHGGRTTATFKIFDYRVATPYAIGWLDVERCNIYREDMPTRPWQKFWYTVRFDLTDNYYQLDDNEEIDVDMVDDYGGY